MRVSFLSFSDQFPIRYVRPDVSGTCKSLSYWNPGIRRLCLPGSLVTVPVTTYVLRQVPGKGCPDHGRVAGFRTVPREADPPNLPSSVIISANLQSNYRPPWAAGTGAGHQRGPYLRRSGALNGHTVLDGVRWTVPSKAARRPARFHSSGTQHSRLEGIRDPYRAPRHWVRQCVLVSATCVAICRRPRGCSAS